jgi:hypothetical protein
MSGADKYTRPIISGRPFVPIGQAIFSEEFLSHNSSGKNADAPEWCGTPRTTELVRGISQTFPRIKSGPPSSNMDG